MLSTGGEGEVDPRRAAKEQHARDLRAQMANDKMRRERQKFEESERDRREEEAARRFAARPTHGGGGEPIKMQDGQVVADLHHLRDETGAYGVVAPGGAPPGGELLERTRLSRPPPVHNLLERTRPGMPPTRGQSRGEEQRPIAGMVGLGVTPSYEQQMQKAAQYKADLEAQISEGQERRAKEVADIEAAEKRHEERSLGIVRDDTQFLPPRQPGTRGVMTTAQGGRMGGFAPPSRGFGMPPGSRGLMPPGSAFAAGGRGFAPVGGFGPVGTPMGMGGGRRITQPLDAYLPAGAPDASSLMIPHAPMMPMAGGPMAPLAETGADGPDGGGALTVRPSPAGMAGGDGPVVVGFTKEQQLQRLLSWEKERAADREKEREKEREREREREKDRNIQMERFAQREREIEKRVRDDEMERRRDFERKLADEISSMRTDFSKQHTTLLKQVESTLARLRLNQAQSVPQFPPAWVMANQYGAPPQGAPPGGDRGAARTKPGRAPRTRPSDMPMPVYTDHVGGLADPYAYRTDVDGASRPMTAGSGSDAADAARAAERPERQKSAGFARSMPVRVGAVGQNTKSAGALPDVGDDELDKLLDEFLKKGADLRGS